MSERMIPLKIADMAVAACNEEIAKLQAENARLKAENERLNTGIQPEGSNDAVGRAVNVLLEKEKEIARLKAKVERLTKAGDELAWAFSFAVSRHDGEPSGLVKAWNAAKEGKQS